MRNAPDAIQKFAPDTDEHVVRLGVVGKTHVGMAQATASGSASASATISVPNVKVPTVKEKAVTKTKSHDDLDELLDVSPLPFVSGGHGDEQT